MKLIIYSSSLALVLYLCGAFFSTSFNITSWDEVIRLTCVFLWILGAAALFGMDQQGELK